jgi:archaeosine synthase beta-subunit
MQKNRQSDYSQYKYPESGLREMRASMISIARNLRVGYISKNQKLDNPLSAKWDESFFMGRKVMRLRMVALGLGCNVATCTMCPLPTESVRIDSRSEKMRKNVSYFMKKQIDFAFSLKPDKQTVVNTEKIFVYYSNGNVLDRNEIPKDVLTYIFNRVANSNFSTLVVESLPQFINEEVVNLAKTHLKGKKLFVMVGLQSASNDPLVRELAINTTCTTVNFVKALDLLRGIGGEALTFLMFKPPFLTENEAIIDLVESVGWIYKFGVYSPTICPTRVAPNTILSILYEDGDFRLPWLWSLVESLKLIHHLYPNSMPRIAVGEIKPENNCDSICPANCKKCTKKFIKIFEKYNQTGDFKLIDDIDSGFCSCHADYDTYLSTEKNKFPIVNEKNRIPDRVNKFLLKHHQMKNCFL